MNGVTTEYFLNGSTIVAEKKNGKMLTYLFDESGSRFGFTYEGNTYYYRYTPFGDVEAILDSTGNRVVSYYYDAWGDMVNVSGTMASTIGALNPIRYRGYYFDAETGFYYLQSRYYDPVVGRFINADVFASTGQGPLACNMYAYCGNNPICKADKTGTSGEDVLGGLGVLGALAGIIAGMPILAGGFAIIGLVSLGVYVAEELNDDEDAKESDHNESGNRLSDKIDWDKADSNHILHGSKGTRARHEPGWRQLGIDPNGGNNSWEKLKNTVDKGKKISTRGIQNGNGANLTEYALDYEKEGVTVIVRVWEKNGVYKLSDAYNKFI